MEHGTVPHSEVSFTKNIKAVLAVLMLAMKNTLAYLSAASNKWQRFFFCKIWHKPKSLIFMGLKGLPGTNTFDYRPHSYVA